jgi:MFS family permease
MVVPGLTYVLTIIASSLNVILSGVAAPMWIAQQSGLNQCISFFYVRWLCNSNNDTPIRDVPTWYLCGQQKDLLYAGQATSLFTIAFTITTIVMASLGLCYKKRQVFRWLTMSFCFAGAATALSSWALVLRFRFAGLCDQSPPNEKGFDQGVSFGLWVTDFCIAFVMGLVNLRWPAYEKASKSTVQSLDGQSQPPKEELV